MRVTTQITGLQIYSLKSIKFLKFEKRKLMLEHYDINWIKRELNLNFKTWCPLHITARHKYAALLHAKLGTFLKSGKSKIIDLYIEYYFQYQSVVLWKPLIVALVEIDSLKGKVVFQRILLSNVTTIIRYLVHLKYILAKWS